MSEYLIQYDQYSRQFILQYSYLSPSGQVLHLVDNEGERVVDRVDAPSEHGVYAARAYMQAEETLSTLRAMDQFA